MYNFRCSDVFFITADIDIMPSLFFFISFAKLVNNLLVYPQNGNFWRHISSLFYVFYFIDFHSYFCYFFSSTFFCLISYSLSNDMVA